MNYFKKLSVVVAMIFIFSSCEKMVTNIDPPKAEKELVMFSFLSPEDTIVRVDLSYSSPVFGTSSFGETEYISNALVTIQSNTGETDTLVYQSNYQAYFANKSFVILPGLEYTIRAEYLGKVAIGKTTVPTEKIKIDTIETLKSVGQQGEGLIKIKTTWQDPGNLGMYYRAYSEQLYDFGGGSIEAYGICSEFLSNSGKQNKKMVNTCETNYYEGGSGIKKFNIVLLTTDNHYYEYHRRRVNYFGDDPFSEPIPQYLNVKGGIGVVASYRKELKQLSL